LTEKRRRPEPIADVLSAFLKTAGLAKRVDQASVIPEWEKLVGKQIASVTSPLHITPDGTLFVAVRTNAWMTELSLLEPELLRSLNSKPGRPPVKKMRWQILR